MSIERPIHESSSGFDSMLLEIDALCLKFEENWTPESSASQVALLLTELSSKRARSRLFRELVATDCELRTRRQLNLATDPFCEQFPDYRQEVEEAVTLWEHTEFSCGLEKDKVGFESLPDRIGEYRVVREVGRGGTSVVLEAVQPELDRRVALKTFVLSPVRSREQRQRFALEVKAASLLEHENIVSVYHSGESDGLLYYAMQFVDGVNLHHVIREQATSTDEDGARRMDPQRIAVIIAQATSALDYAHRRGVLHRDIKPSNLLLDQNEAVRLTDFGLAQLTDSDVQLTATGNVVGSLRYLPPEAFDGIRNERSDVYGLGLTLYEMLTLQPAFPEKDRSKLISNIQEFNVRWPRQIDNSIPRDLETITMKAMAPELSDRYASAKELGDDLERYLAGEPIHARPVTMIERAWKWTKRRPDVASALAFVGFMFLVVLPIVLLMWQSRELQLTELALREEQASASAFESEALAERERARAAGAATARADAEYALLINNAQNAIKAGDYTYAAGRMIDYERNLLEKMAAGADVIDRRDWEWNFLRRSYDQAAITIPSLESTIVSLKLCPDESCFAVVGQTWDVKSSAIIGGSIRLRDSLTGELLRTFAEGEEIFCDACFSPDGSRLATISLHDSTKDTAGWIRLWDVASGERILSRKLVDDYPLEELATPGSVKAFLPQIEFGPEGKMLVTSSPVIAFDSETLTPKWKQEGGRAFVVPGGVAIVVRSTKRGIRKHDLASGDPMADDFRSCFLPLELRIDSEKNECLIVGRGAGTVQFYRNGEKELSRTRYREIPKSYWTSFAGSGDRIFRSEIGGDLVIQEVTEGGLEIDRLVGHQTPVVAGALSRQQDRLITADRNGVVKIWRLGSTGNRVTADLHDVRSQAVEAIAFSKSGDRIHYANCNFYEESYQSAGWVSSDGAVHENLVIETTNHIFWPRHDISYSSDGSLLAAPARERERAARNELLGYSRSGKIHIWSTETNQVVKTIDIGRENRITAIAWRSDNQQLAVATTSDADTSISRIGLVSLADPGESEIEWQSNISGEVSCLRYTPDHQLVLGFIGARVAILSPDSADLVEICSSSAASPGASTCLDVDPTGTRLAVAVLDSPGVRIFDLENLEMIRKVNLSSEICSLQFSPNGKRLAVVDQLSVMHLVATSSGHPLLTLDGRSDTRRPTPGTSVKVIFSPDGRQIATQSLGGRVTIWDGGEK